MIAWKAFAAFSIIIFGAWLGAAFLGREPIGAIDILSLPIELTGVYGLTTFAFSLHSFPRKFWQKFHPVYAVFAVWDLARADIEWRLNFETIASVSIGLVIAFFSWLALFRMAGPGRPLEQSQGASS